MEEQLALMKLAGWQLEEEESALHLKTEPRWVVRITPDYAFLLSDKTKDQAIRRAFGYFMQGLR